MAINQQENRCSRCHQREKFFETFKTCFYCSTKHCNQCWLELQQSENSKLFIDIHQNQTKRICATCIQNLLEHRLKSSERKDHIEEDYQLALAMSLSQNDAEEQKRKVDEEEIKKVKKNNLVEQTAEAIEKFMNRAKSNYQRNRDATGDTALLSAFISLQTYANELEQLKQTLTDQRQHFETLQEKLTALRDAREALNILRYEYQQNKRQEQDHLDQQRRLVMMQKVAELRQLKHTQIANYQENYFQRLLDEEQEMTERLNKQKRLKADQFGS